MSFSYTYSQTATFTLTHAKHMAAKVATDLKRLQRFYGKPNDQEIDAYESEIVSLLKAGYLEKVTYGFRRNGNWIEPTIQYTARDLVGVSVDDDDPGKIRPGADIKGAFWGSYLIYSSSWDSLSQAERIMFERDLPFQRSSGAEPGLNGYLSKDRTYSSGGRALDRASLRSY